MFPAADLAELHVAVAVDVRDVQPDLIDVAHDRQERSTRGSRDPRERRTDVVGAHFGGESRAIFPPDLGRSAFRGPRDPQL